MGEIRSTYERGEKFIQNFGYKSERKRYHLKKTRHRGEIILERILEKK
jgi:hypothetical protein